MPHPGLAIYRNCIELESNVSSVGDKDGLINARKLYESALSTYDQNVSLWQDYYSMEAKVNFALLSLNGGICHLIFLVAKTYHIMRPEE